MGGGGSFTQQEEASVFAYNTLSICKKQRCMRERDNRPVRQLGLGDFCQAQVQGSWQRSKVTGLSGKSLGGKVGTGFREAAGHVLELCGECLNLIQPD